MFCCQIHDDWATLHVVSHCFVCFALWGEKSAYIELNSKLQMSPKDLDCEQPMNKYPLGMEFPVFTVIE